ncbi:Ribonuclease H-like domain containing protein [Canna indica]|uniref:Ribonuclease H-like domain containing protein n=1 Tax=Canna indica TaxID=4628 RepID=A0AAQ3KGL5_9LILI|nr:Ribonuclease H-like domain containing protein [Canna indica]
MPRGRRSASPGTARLCPLRPVAAWRGRTDDGARGSDSPRAWQLCRAVWKSKEVAAGFGAYIANTNGIGISNVFFSKSICSPITVEIWAIWYDLTKAKEPRLDKVEVLSNCLRAINILNKKDKPQWFMYSLVRDIWLIRRSFVSCVLNHIERDSNHMVHTLANEGCRNVLALPLLTNNVDAHMNSNFHQTSYNRFSSKKVVVDNSVNKQSSPAALASFFFIAPASRTRSTECYEMVCDCEYCA